MTLDDLSKVYDASITPCEIAQLKNTYEAAYCHYAPESGTLQWVEALEITFEIECIKHAIKHGFVCVPSVLWGQR